MTPPGAALDSPRPKRRTRRRFSILLLLALVASVALWPPAWHAALRGFILWQATHRGWAVEMGGIEGGLFDATVIHDLHCRKTFPAPSPNDDAGGVDVRLARVEAVLAWRLPFVREEGNPGWLERLTVEGLGGTMDFTSAGAVESAVARPIAAALHSADLTPGFVLKRWPMITAPPANFQLLDVNCRVRRGPVALQLQGTRLTAYRDQPGQFVARHVQISGPGFENTLDNRVAQTVWRDGRLTLSDLSLGPGLDLMQITLDTARLRKREVEWVSELRALGGRVRSNGTVRFAHARFGLDVAGQFQDVAVRPLARLIGVEGATDGTVDQGQFSFRGNPEQWTRATVSLSGQATDFRWQQRRWEHLYLSVIVLNGRVTVRQLDLSQSRNQLSFSGECALPAEGAGPVWSQPGFSCQVNAKLDDLRSLAQLLGPGLPEVAGRMSLNGSLAARTQGQGLDGYLNVEGSALTVAGAPVDFLRSTLLFQGEDLNVADLQVTHATDYLSGKGAVRIFGPLRYQGELHAAVAKMEVYYQAYAPWSVEPFWGSMRLNWSGDGAPGAHSGAIRGSVADFRTAPGPIYRSRPISVEADATYSPESLSFRQLALKEGIGDKRHDAIKFEGALPWARNPLARTPASWLDFSKPMAGRILLADGPMDLIAELADLGVAEGQISGWLDLAGTPEAPHLNGNLQLRKVALQGVEGGSADVRIEDSMVRLDDAHGRRAGADWEVGGSVDWRQPAKPLLDVTFKSARAPGSIRTGLVHGDAEVALYARGPWGGPEIGGEVRLTNAAMTHWLDLAPADGANDGGWELLAKPDECLPGEWHQSALALHVTAAKPLRGLLGGEFAPDLMIGGTGAAPVVSGALEVRKMSLFSPAQEALTTETGTIYFSAGAVPRANVSLKGGGLLLGSVEDLQVIAGKDAAVDLGKLWQQSERLPADAMWAEEVGWPPEPEEQARMALRWR